MLQTFVRWGLWAGVVATAFVLAAGASLPGLRHTTALSALCAASSAIAAFCLCALALHARARRRRPWFGALVVSGDFQFDDSISGYVVDVIALRAIDEPTAIARAQAWAEKEAAILNRSRLHGDPEQRPLYVDVWACDAGDIEDGSEVWSIGMHSDEAPEQFLRRFQRPGEDLR